MAEYTYNNVIIDPTSEEAKSYIGKEVYYSNTPMECLARANGNNTHFLTRLNNINDECPKPFIIDKADFISSESNVVCIIPKKEDLKPKYIPFENVTEFLDAYRSYAIWLGEQDLYLSNHGIWLKDKDIDGVSYIVTEIWRDGVVLGSDQHTTIWKDLLDGYAFLNGSHCGKEVKE